MANSCVNGAGRSHGGLCLSLTRIDVGFSGRIYAAYDGIYIADSLALLCGSGPAAYSSALKTKLRLITIEMLAPS